MTSWPSRTTKRSNISRKTYNSKRVSPRCCFILLWAFYTPKRFFHLKWRNYNDKSSWLSLHVQDNTTWSKQQKYLLSLWKCLDDLITFTLTTPNLSPQINRGSLTMVPTSVWSKRIFHFLSYFIFRFTSSVSYIQKSSFFFLY